MKLIAIILVALVASLAGYSQNVGIGVTAPTQKLDVSGNIKVSGAIMPNGVAGTAGQVLISNGDNIAPEWGNTAYTGAGRFLIIPASNSRSTGGFLGRGGWNLDGAANLTSQEDSLDFGSSATTGSDFSISDPGLSNNFITVNRTGLYHIEGTLRYFVTSTISVNLLPRATLEVEANQPTASDLNILVFEDLHVKTGGSETSNSTNTYNYTGRFQINIQLQAGTTFTFKTGFNLLRYPSATNLIAIGVSQGGYISGYFIAE